MKHKIIRLPSVKEQTGYSRSTIYERMRDGEFPKTINLGGRMVGWLQSDIDEWIDQRIAESRKDG